MDIAKYIGLFLLKNHSVYIHGLGNLELRRKPATYNGDSLQPSSYEVVMTPIGSIDDNLANFIATNEQVSISKASNELREFSSVARMDIQAGKTVEIPSIGHFMEERGKLIFVTNPQFQYTPPPVQAMKITRKLDETPYANSAGLPVSGMGYQTDEEGGGDDDGGISWVKVAIWILGGVLLILAIYAAMVYTSDSNKKEIKLNLPQTDTPQTQESSVINPLSEGDSTTLQEAVELPATEVDSSKLLDFDVVINTYQDFGKAVRRTEKLTSYGNKVELVTDEDSTTFWVLMPMTQIPAWDTTRVLDSLRRTFNPDGVRIFD